MHKKYRVNISDAAYDFARYEMGSFGAVMYGVRAIWRSFGDGEYYTLDPKVPEFYSDLDSSIRNMEELQDRLISFCRGKGDAERIVHDWIADYFDHALTDAWYMIRDFSQWAVARASFIEMIAYQVRLDPSYEPILNDFVRYTL